MPLSKCAMRSLNPVKMVFVKNCDGELKLRFPPLTGHLVCATTHPQTNHLAYAYTGFSPLEIESTEFCHH